MSEFIRKENYVLEYFRYGSGKKVILSFHGFGNNATDFSILEGILCEDYTILSLNLFFHGKSHADKSLVDKGFEEAEWKSLLDDIFEKFPAEKYSLIGYSMGGRFVLKTLELFPGNIEKAILLAPDGIQISPLYRFLTQNSLGHHLFRKVVNRPGSFYKIADLLRRSRIISEKKYKFGIGNFDSEQKRQNLYRIWMIFRKIFSDGQEIRNILKKNNIHLYMFYGKHDRIIPPSIGENFQKTLKDKISFYILDAGHKLIKENLLREVALKSGLISKVNNGMKST